MFYFFIFFITDVEKFIQPKFFSVFNKSLLIGREFIKLETKVILPVDRNAGNCLVKGSTCAPLLTSVPLRDPPQEPVKKQSGAAAADRTPTPKSVTVSPNTKRTRTVQIFSHSQLYNSQA